MHALLRRPGTDRIDLYQLHVGTLDPAEAASVQETLEALADEGSRRLRLEHRRLGWARRCAGGPHFAAVQHELNVLENAPVMLEVREELGLASINCCQVPTAT